MSEYYNPKRTRNLFDPKSKNPFKISRSKIDLFLECPRCFYIDRRLGVGRPPGFPFNLNSAVDHLLKKEFDIHRVKKTRHPLMEAYGIEAIPFTHKLLDKWRENFVGIDHFHEESNLIISGAVDDIWVDMDGNLMVVDYKSTSKDSEINLDADWQISYKRQIEVYQWLLRQNGFKVSDTGYFVYANGLKDKQAFDGKLEFEVTIIPYKGNANWIEGVLFEIRDCLKSGNVPEADKNCDYCNYVHNLNGVVSENKNPKIAKEDYGEGTLF